MFEKAQAQSPAPAARRPNREAGTEAEPGQRPHLAPTPVVPQVRTKLYERFNIHHRLQHAGILSSFTVCALTGLPIKYSSAAWAELFVRWLGGIDAVLAIHLVAAVVLIASSLYHLAYLSVSFLQGKRSLAMMPTLKDVTDVFDNIRYRFGLIACPPRYDRYSYKEKFDYMAVFWGMVIMAGSGLFMWFPGFFGQFVPRWLIESSRVAHSDEAMLAILAIFVWHFFNVHFNPTAFPANLAFLTGKMSHEEMEREHPVELERISGSRSSGRSAGAAGAGAKVEAPAKLDRNWAFIIAEMTVYLVVLGLFLKAFLPVGLQ